MNEISNAEAQKAQETTPGNQGEDLKSYLGQFITEMKEENQKNLENIRNDMEKMKSDFTQNQKLQEEKQAIKKAFQGNDAVQQKKVSDDEEMRIVIEKMNKITSSRKEDQGSIEEMFDELSRSHNGVLNKFLMGG